MSLMKKIAILFIGFSIVSSLAFCSVGITIIGQNTLVEMDKSSEKANAVVYKFKDEINRIGDKAIEVGEYYQVTERFTNDELDINNIMSIEKKSERDYLTNSLILDEDFNIIRVIRKRDNVSMAEIRALLPKMKNIIYSKDNEEKGFFSGIVFEGEYPYIAAVQRLEYNNETQYIFVLSRIDNYFIYSMSNTIEKNISIFNSNDIEKNLKNMSAIKIEEKQFYCNIKEDTIDIYTELEHIDNSDGKYYIRLIDDREIKNSVEKNVYELVAVIIIFTILTNIVIYFIIKKYVLSRILSINKTVNNVRYGAHFDVELKDDKRLDEIAELNNDLNSMLRQLKSYSENLEFISMRDTLTKLSNRYSIHNYITRLTEAMDEFTVFFIDLDNFKVINDTLGHNVGDELLMEVANILESIVSEEENLIAGRLGGDEFILIRRNENNTEEAERLAKKILDRLNKCYEFNSYMYEIKASMGISFFPQQSLKSDEILQYSDIAMYCSKREGGNTFNIFKGWMLGPLRIEKRLKKAIEKKEFRMYLQPIYNIKKDRISGCEALIRWYDNGQIISPYEFISLAKRTGDIVKIDNFIFKEAVREARALLHAGKKEFYISVNTSKLFLKQENLLEFVAEELRINNVDSKYIKMEVAEDEIIDDFEYTIGLLNQLRAIGIEIYLDDFGVGYSSFNHIKILPIDVIKIDRSLLLDIESNIKSQEIVKTLINLAHSLNIGIICEGIEDLGQVELLRELNCDNIQGYYFGKPVPKDDFIGFL